LQSGCRTQNGGEVKRGIGGIRLPHRLQLGWVGELRAWKSSRSGMLQTENGENNIRRLIIFLFKNVFFDVEKKAESRPHLRVFSSYPRIETPKDADSPFATRLLFQ
jgi:hypothetical protein